MLRLTVTYYIAQLHEYRQFTFTGILQSLQFSSGTVIWLHCQHCITFSLHQEKKLFCLVTEHDAKE